MGVLKLLTKDSEGEGLLPTPTPGQWPTFLILAIYMGEKWSFFLNFSYDGEIEFTLWGLAALDRPWAERGSPAPQAGASTPNHWAILPPLVVSPTWFSRFGHSVNAS